MFPKSNGYLRGCEAIRVRNWDENQGWFCRNMEGFMW